MYRVIYRKYFCCQNRVLAPALAVFVQQVQVFANKTRPSLSAQMRIYVTPAVRVRISLKFAIKTGEIMALAGAVWCVVVVLALAFTHKTINFN